MTRTVTPHPFEIPSVELPKLFTGYVCFVFAGERYHCGCDTNNAEDAYFDALRSARLSMKDSCAVDKTIDPRPHAGSVLCFRVGEA